MEELVFIQNQGPTNFNKFGNHLEILGTRRVTWHVQKISWATSLIGFVHLLIQGYYVKASLVKISLVTIIWGLNVFIKIKFIEEQMKHNAVFVPYGGKCLL